LKTKIHANNYAYSSLLSFKVLINQRIKSSKKNETPEKIMAVLNFPNFIFSMG
jgi:hypothetical protein